MTSQQVAGVGGHIRTCDWAHCDMCMAVQMCVHAAGSAQGAIPTFSRLLYSFCNRVMHPFCGAAMLPCGLQASVVCQRYDRRCDDWGTARLRPFHVPQHQ